MTSTHAAISLSAHASAEDVLLCQVAVEPRDMDGARPRRLKLAPRNNPFAFLRRAAVAAPNLGLRATSDQQGEHQNAQRNLLSAGVTMGAGQGVSNNGGHNG
jgi:hypothetical protein